MTNKKIASLAAEALRIMTDIPDDSFGPRDAVRALPEWDLLSKDERRAINAELDLLISRG